jgi:hypothetical protein
MIKNKKNKFGFIEIQKIKREKSFWIRWGE